VCRDQVSKRVPRDGLIRRRGRRRTPLRRRLTAPPTGVRRVRCSPAVDAATPSLGAIARCGDDASARRADANRVGAAHQSDFLVRRTPPRHPPRGPPKSPPKSRQRRSQPRVSSASKHDRTTSAPLPRLGRSTRIRRPRWRLATATPSAANVYSRGVCSRAPTPNKRSPVERACIDDGRRLRHGRSAPSVR
jgi:hypothetical protein